MPTSPRIRVAYCTNSVALGGMENHVLELAMAVGRLGCEVSAIVPNEPAIAPFVVALRDRGIPVEMVTLQGGQPLARYGAEAARLRHILRQRRIEVFHQHRTGPYHGKWACLAAKAAGVSAIVATEHLPAFPLIGTKRMINAIADRVVDRIVTVCELDRQRQIRDTWRNAEKVVTIHNGIDVSRFEPGQVRQDALDVRHELGIEVDAPVLGVVARLSVEKGHIHLLRALPPLMQQWPKMVVIMAGEGPERASLEAESARMGLSGSVRFVGQRSDVARILRAIDLVVLPSLKESFPISLLEAMAMRLPAVVTDVGGVSEAVIDGENGFVVPAASPESLTSAIARCLQGDALDRMGAAGRGRVEQHFTADGMAAKTVALYRSIVGK